MRKAEAREELLKMLNPGSTVWTVLQHVSQSGMSRAISLKIIRENDIVDISGYASILLDRRIDNKHRGIKIQGCGMDMGFSLVYELGSVLWPNGTPEPHGARNGEPDRTGGYALRQRWI